MSLVHYQQCSSAHKMICNANSSMAAVALIALLLSVFQVPLHASGTQSDDSISAESSSGSFSRLLAYDLPLPHDWIREYEKDTRDMSQSFSYSYSFSFEYAPTTSPSLVPAIAPTMQPNLPGTIPVVNLFLVVAGTPEEQFALVSALVLYFIMALDVQESDISVDTPVLERLLHRSRRLADTDQGRLCSSGAPQNSTSISIRNYEDAAKVQDSLDGIMNGTISLTAVEGDSTTFPVKDGICHGETTLSFVPPPADTLNDKNKSSSEPEPLSATYISLIAVGGVAILCVIIFVARRRRPRSTVVAHN